MAALVIGEVDFIVSGNSETTGAYIWLQRIFGNLHCFGIDFGKFVGAELTEKWNTFTVDLDAVGVRVFGWDFFQFDLSCLRIETADHVAGLHCEPKRSL